jgi:uncharacterized protein YyaL (SSP411 family)
MQKEPRKPNRLASEKSPYLLKHAFNPVDWYSWSDEALKKAKNDGKPIFLSIGYSTCHWCTVMERESFEDEKIAAVVNKNFIAIKVDREERPEIDAYYMGAVQAMTGGGGWPLSVFLTPDLKPFYGGTYFPPEPRYGMPSFRQVLEFVAQVWKDKREEILQNSEQIAKGLLGGLKPKETTELTPKMLEEGYAGLVSSFDPEHGGFGGAPKFPLPLTSAFLLRYHSRTGKELAKRSVVKTLDEMLAGGIRDHLGGRFHRYSTDRVWLVPHFEKMLYDNALLAKLYTEAYQETGRDEYRRVVQETIGWILGEMTDPGGGFYSAQDADPSEGEGIYYTWTPEEVAGSIGTRPAEAFNRSYGVTKNGNFEGRTILHIVTGNPTAKEAKGLEKSRSELYQARIKRPRPSTDTKVLTSWNGLAISALAYAGSALDVEDYVKAAARAAEFILEKNSADGRLLRRYAGGEAALDGTLEDYAFFVQGLLDLFEASADPRWLEEAVRLTKVMGEDFEDKENGGYFFTAKAEPMRLKEGYDGPTPSGNSVAALDLIRVSELTGDEEYKRSAERLLKFFSFDLGQQPTAHACMLTALDLLVNGVKEVVITAPNDAAAKAMQREVAGAFLPGKVLIVATKKTYARLRGYSRLLEGRKPGLNARAFVCQNYTCLLPASTPEALRAQLDIERG